MGLGFLLGLSAAMALDPLIILFGLVSGAVTSTWAARAIAFAAALMGIEAAIWLIGGAPSPDPLAPWPSVARGLALAFWLGAGASGRWLWPRRS